MRVGIRLDRRQQGPLVRVAAAAAAALRCAGCVELATSFNLVLSLSTPRPAPLRVRRLAAALQRRPAAFSPIYY